MKAYLFVLCLLGSSYVYAQDTVFRFHYPQDSLPIDAEVHALTLTSRDGDGHSCLVLREGSQLRYFLLDSQFRVLGQFREALLPTVNLFLLERANSLGSLFKDGVFTNYFTLKYPRWPLTLYTKTIDFKTGTTFETPVLNSDRVNDRMGYILDNNDQPYLLALDPEITEVYLEHEAGDHDNKDVIDASVVDSPDVHFGFIHFVPEDQPQQFNNVSERTLAFARGHQLVLLSRGDRQPLHLAIVDLQSAQAHFRELSTTDGFAALPQGSTYGVAATIRDDKLFILRSSLNKAEIGIYQIPSLQLLRVVTVTPGSMPRSPLLLSTGGYLEGAPNIKENGTSAAFFSGLQKDPTAIAVNRNNQGDYLLSIGFYNDPDTRYSYTDDGVPKYDPGESKTRHAKGRATRQEIRLLEGDDRSLSQNSLDGRRTKKYALNPGGLIFKAGVLEIVLDATTLDRVDTWDPLPGQQVMRNVMTPATYHFQAGAHQYTGAYDRLTHTYNIREIHPSI
jgi:hypothetical protein